MPPTTRDFDHRGLTAQISQTSEDCQTELMQHLVQGNFIPCTNCSYFTSEISMSKHVTKDTVGSATKRHMAYKNSYSNYPKCFSFYKSFEDIIQLE